MSLLNTGVWFGAMAGLLSHIAVAGQIEVQVESQDHVSLVFTQHLKTDTGLDLKKVVQPEAYTVSRVDGEHDAGQGQAPVRVGRESRLGSFEVIEWPYRIETIEHRIYLQLAEPLVSGGSYELTIAPEAGFGKPETLRFDWDADATINRNIKANQVGYLPDAGSKIAYLGGYLGSLGPLPIDEVNTFHLVDAESGEPVFTGTPTLVLENDPDSGENLCVLDFSEFQQPGRYFLQVPGVGRSHPFKIADDVYQDVFRTVARGLYHQRCGIALTEEYTRFTREACHTGTALLTTATGDSDDMSSLPAKVVEGKTIDGQGGWHDAGDYDRRGVHIAVVDQLLTIYEIVPEHFTDGQLNIPESGNGVPDILDEAAWGLQWFERMQDPEDGGVHYRIETANFAFHKMPDDDHQQLYAYAKDPWTTIRVAGTAAQAARIFRDLDPQRAAKYLEMAEAAWAYGQAHANPNDRRITAAMAHAAVELFKTTGNSEYHDAIPADGMPYEACWAYATSTQPGTDEKLRSACKRRVIARAKKYARTTQEPGYHRPVRSQPSWGNGANTTRAVMEMIQGYVLTDDQMLYDAALLALGHQLGANPLGMTWITGVGYRPTSVVAHNPSIADGIDEPVPGIPIYGYARMYGASTKAKLYWSVLYPGVPNGYADNGPASTFPMLRRWCPEPRIYIMNEFTIHENMSPAVFCYGFFIQEAGDKHP